MRRTSSCALQDAEDHDDATSVEVHADKESASGDEEVNMKSCNSSACKYSL